MNISQIKTILEQQLAKNCFQQPIKIESISPLSSISNTNDLNKGFTEAKYASDETTQFPSFFPITVNSSNLDTKKPISLDIVIKTNQSQFIDVFEQSLAHANIHIDMPLKQTVPVIEFKQLQLGEPFYYQLQKNQPSLTKHSPKYYGHHISKDQQTTYTFIEAIHDLSHINDSTNAPNWPDHLYNEALVGITYIHSIFFNRPNVYTDVSNPTPWIDTQAYLSSNELWFAMAKATCSIRPKLVTKAHYQLHCHIIESLSEWHAKMDLLPKTIIQGDYNPRNMGFRPIDGKLRACILDWECVRVSLPQFDVAQFLLYACDKDNIVSKTKQALKITHEYMQQLTGQAIDFRDWRDGLKYCFYDHLINRIPLLMIVFDLFPPQFDYSTRLYNNVMTVIKSDIFS